MYIRIQAKALPWWCTMAAIFLYRLGKAMSGVTAPWAVLEMGGKANDLGATAVALTVTSVIGFILGGRWTDRQGPRQVLWMSGISGGLLMTIASVVSSQHAYFAFAAIALLVMTNLVDAPILMAQESRLPELSRMARIVIQRTVVAKTAASHLGLVLGPVLAGAVLTHLSMPVCLGLIAGCLLTATLVAAPVYPNGKPRRSTSEAADSEQNWGPLLRRLYSNGSLRTAILFCALLAGCAASANSVVIPALLQSSDSGALQFGSLISALGAGTLTGTMLTGMLSRFPSIRVAFVAAYSAHAVMWLVIASQPSLAVSLTIAFFTGVAGSLMPLAIGIEIYKQVPLAMRGRSLGIYSAILMIAAVATIAIGTATVQTIGAIQTLLALAFVATFSALVSLKSIGHQHTSTRLIDEQNGKNPPTTWNKSSS